MEESGNKGLGSTMQSDTSLHDSALKWWDGCEAETLPFNEGLSLAPFSSYSCLSKKEPFNLLSLYFSLSLFLPGWWDEVGWSIRSPINLSTWPPSLTALYHISK